MAPKVDLAAIPQFSEDPKAARDFFHTHGYYVELVNGFKPEECRAVIDAAKEFDEFTSGRCTPKMMPHRESPAFVEIMKDRRITKLAANLLGARISGMQSEFFFCKPGTLGFANHQDNFYVEAENGQMISAWMPLVDVTRNNGGLVVYPGTNREGHLPTRKFETVASAGQDPHARDQETVVPPKYPAHDLEMPAGSILFIHSYLVHGSNQNVSSRHRFVVLNTYIQEGIRFRAGNHANRAPVDLEMA